MPLKTIQKNIMKKNADAGVRSVNASLLAEIAAYIDKTYVEAPPDNAAMESLRMAPFEADKTDVSCDAVPKIQAASLDEALSQIDESFSEMLLRKIDESGMTDSQCYRKAHIDRRLFSKIRSNPQYQPSRQTVIAFGIALELPLDEMKELLEKAGFALSHANKADLIVEFFIRRGNYNLYEINEALSAFGQTLLGA